MTALQLEPDLPRAHFAMGMSYYQGQRDYPKALDEFEIAIKGLPNDAEIWQLVGAVNRRLGNWNEVIPAFEKAVQLDPRRADLYVILPGFTFDMMRRYPESVRAFDQALSLAPDLHWAAVSRGWTYVRWQGQLDTLRATLGRIPQNAELGGAGSMSAHRAELLLWERNPDGLLQMLRKEQANVFAANFSLLPTALYVAWAQRQRGDHTAARAAFAEALVRSDSAMHSGNDDWRPHVARGLALAGLGRVDEVRSEARWLQRTFLYQSDANEGRAVAKDRAWILAEAGDADAAIDELERLMAAPAQVSIHTLRLDPHWDLIRDHPRFKALLAKYSFRRE
jgi:serine/threonine-protein kinase